MEKPWVAAAEYISPPASDNLKLLTRPAADSNVSATVTTTQAAGEWEKNFLADTDGHIGASNGPKPETFIRA